MNIVALDKLIRRMFLPFQLDKIGWNELTEDNKMILLDIAMDELDRLQWIGDPVDSKQEHAWPRVINEEVIELGRGVDKAIAQYIFDYLYINNNDAINNIRSGITSIKVEGASESYASDSNLDTSYVYKNYRRYLDGLIYRGGGR